jgi:hypothetical protein
MWAWTVPHHTEPGFSTPIPEGQGPDVLSGNVGFASGDFNIRILPDTFAASLDTPAETVVKVDWGVATYEWAMEKGKKKITKVNKPPAPTAEIQTTYLSGVHASDQSGYGRGTTAEDLAGGTADPRSTRLGFHEGNHGLDFVAFMKDNKPPVHGGGPGTVQDFTTANAVWMAACARYQKAMEADSLKRTDCVGFTIDQEALAHPVAGKKFVRKCKK